MQQSQRNLKVTFQPDCKLKIYECNLVIIKIIHVCLDLINGQDEYKRVELIIHKNGNVQ